MTALNYGQAWAEVLIFLLGGFLFAGAALLVSRLIRPHRPGDQKLSSYESGEQAKGSAWVQFNVRYYIIALIFLLFEVEIVFLFPWATVLSEQAAIEATGGEWGFWLAMEMTVFVLVLALGLAYAWRTGLLDGVKPKPKAPNFTSVVPRHLYDQINQRYQQK
ncbi:MAG: NADH-quinone oxidoreductase subunit A [Cyclobacteriaceae bacterium]|jgi:NADH-quinone oxidoreductase subunit A